MSESFGVWGASPPAFMGEPDVPLAAPSSAPTDSPPTMANTKQEILDWLDAHGVQADEDLTKPELLDLVPGEGA